LGVGRARKGPQRDPLCVQYPVAQSDPLLAERVHAALLSGVEQVEMELRRKVEETTGNGSVRSPGGETVPQGYADAVAEYFRKLSKSKVGGCLLALPRAGDKPSSGVAPPVSGATVSQPQLLRHAQREEHAQR
jgi:hypothetical protein